MPPNSDVLSRILDSVGPAAIAVSGGVDSLTLALYAETRHSKFEIYHAISPAVPEKATMRVRSIAAERGWDLHEIRAGEFDDMAYLQNPYNRCFFCKQNLYAEISKHTELTILSGTNLDDLSDYRPGLIAARENGVMHPFVEASITKNEVRQLARILYSQELSELPAAPCLSSRIETGLRIEPHTLLAVNRIEERIADRYSMDVVRCRVRESEFTIELDASSLRKLSGTEKTGIRAIVANEFRQIGASKPISFAVYAMGSAFLDEVAS